MLARASALVAFSVFSAFSALPGTTLPVAAAQAAPPGQDGRLGLRLGAQTSWVATGGTLSLDLIVDGPERPSERGDGSPGDSVLVVSVHPAVSSRSQFTQTLDGYQLGRVLVSRTFPLAVDPARGTVPVALPLADIPRASADAEGGVYPVSVALQDASGERLARFFTHLVRLPDGGDAPPLAVAWAQPIGAPPALLADGSIELAPEALEQLDIVARALEVTPSVPLTMVPVPETLDALAALGPSGPSSGVDGPSGPSSGVDGPATLTALRRATVGRQVVTNAYVELDVAAYGQANLVDEVYRQRAEGLRTVEASLGTRSDLSTWVSSESLAEDGLTRLRDLAVERIMLPEGSFAPVDRPLTLTRPFLLEDDKGRLIAAAAADPGLTAHFSGEDPVLAAHHLLADLAVLWGDEPGIARGVAVSPPDDWRADPAFLAAALPALGTSPILDPVTLDGFFGRLPPADERTGGPLVRILAEAGPVRADLSAIELRRLHGSVEGLGAMIGATDPDVGLLQRLLLVSGADGLSPARRAGYLDQVAARLEEARSLVAVADSSFRITAREGTVPLTLVRTGDEPVTVALELESDQLEFLDGRGTDRYSVVLTLDRAITALDVPVRARTSGEFLMRVRVTSPDGRLEVGTKRVTVRSTAVSGAGVVLSAGAGLFLLVWWISNWRSSRRASRTDAQDAVAPGPTAAAVKV